MDFGFLPSAILVLMAAPVGTGADLVSSEFAVNLGRASHELFVVQRQHAKLEALSDFTRAAFDEAARETSVAISA